MSDEGLDALPEGTAVADYRIGRVLGRGGFGVTYLGRDQFNRAVAIKEFLPEEFAIREGDSTVRPRSGKGDIFRYGLERFLDEARTLAQLDHPNIVRVQRYFEANGTGYLVMDYVEGESLDRLMQSWKRPPDEAALRRLLLALLDGLDHVHAIGFLHRDIKPGNIFIRRKDESPVLLDFGAARQALGSKSRSITAILTPPYAPPEQYARKSDLGPWTDLYAVGVVMYRLIGGDKPEDSVDRQMCLLDGEPDPMPPAAEVGRGRYSESFLAAVDRALKLQPRERSRDVAAWRRQIDPESTVTTEITASETASTETVTAAEAPGTAARPVWTPDAAPMPSLHAAGRGLRRRGLWGAAAMGAVAILVFAWIGWDAMPGREATQAPAPPTPLPPVVVATTPPPATVSPAAPAPPGVRMPQAPPGIAMPPAPATPPPQVAVLPSKPAVELEPIDREFVATSAARVREAPDVRSPQVAGLKEGEAVLVLGKVKDQAWYQIERKGADPAYVAEGLLEDAAAYRKRKEEEQKKIAVVPPPSTPPAPGTVFRDCPECPEMVVIPAGSFMMGSPPGEEQRDSDEGPQRQVNVRAFAAGKYEVTFAEWDACVSAGGCTHNRDDSGWGRGRQPVVNVAWHDAKQYVAWLSRKTGKNYRLLTEAEWEYAARAGTNTNYSWGNDIGRGNGNCNGCGSQWDNRQPAPVGSFRPNAFGLYDIHGNVWEWVEDCWNGSYAGAPSDGSAWTSGNCSSRVLRGGSFFYVPRFVRSASRNNYERSYPVSNYGFRVARTN